MLVLVTLMFVDTNTYSCYNIIHII